ncbi:hypothetical protein GFM44_23300 [Rhizobium leguminosarum bv. viciae]|nr:hypothetical protein [Rhizobium leguminosarum bv. viciae]
MRETNALIRKARRGAKSIVGGEPLLAALTSSRYIQLMEQGVAKSLPPVSMISDLLVEQFEGKVDLESNPVKQFIGSAVRAILSDLGYEVDETGVRIKNDPIFRSGSTYVKIDSEEEDDDILSRFVAMLNVDELQRLQVLVKAAL